jgi:nucleoside-diphosphate-sugar epimerase
MYKVLCFGKNSFIASQLESNIKNDSIHFDWFSRGNESRIGNLIFGDLNNINNNQFLNNSYDCVINFTILKDSTIDENIEFIKNIISYCLKNNVKKLLHFSSPMVYPYNLNYIDEHTEIENLNVTWKGHYARIKLATDKYLLDNSINLPFKICILRPGFVYETFNQVKFSFNILGKIRFLLSDKKSVLPIISKIDLHNALEKLIVTDKIPKVVHLFKNGGTNKFHFTKNNYPNSFIININYLFFLCLPKFIFKYSSKTRLLYSRIEGLFLRNNFSNYNSQNFFK